jgi:hypothetical protein
MADLLDDFLSRDPHRIWSASGAVRHLADRDALRRLAAHVDEIEARTRGVELGGMMRPNATHLAFALRKLRFARDSAECLCTLNAQDDLVDPDREAREGRVTRVSEDPATWSCVCRCNACGREWRVERREYHYPWWIWTAPTTASP